MNIENFLQPLPRVIIRQKRELVELFGFESRNKYSIETEDGSVVAYAAEQQKGVLGFFLRQILGHWRTFELHIFSPTRQLEFIAHHPFRFYFQRLEIRTAAGEYLGALERKFEILGKHFDLFDRHGNLIASVRSPIWKIWTFPFIRHGQEYALVSKKWSGFLKEVFMDADNFVLNYTDPSINKEERILLLAAAIFIDLRYFEQKGSGGGNLLDIFSS